MNKKSEATQRSRLKRRHPCIDCGGLCDYRVTRCRVCSNIHSKKVKYNLPAKKDRLNYCIDCGKQITWSNTQMPKRCRDCNIINFAVANSLKGENSKSWKGGIYKGRNGYIYCYKPEHPRACNNYVPQHILVWEEVNHKRLPTRWIIHHLNGIKHDNRISNLQAMPNKKHYLVLNAKAKRIQELEALLRQQGQLI